MLARPVGRPEVGASAAQFTIPALCHKDHVQAICASVRRTRSEFGALVRGERRVQCERDATVKRRAARLTKPKS